MQKHKEIHPKNAKILMILSISLDVTSFKKQLHFYLIYTFLKHFFDQYSDPVKAI